jgi:hypothetical protein
MWTCENRAKYKWTRVEPLISPAKRGRSKRLKHAELTRTAGEAKRSGLRAYDRPGNRRRLRRARLLKGARRGLSCHAASAVWMHKTANVLNRARCRCKANLKNELHEICLTPNRSSAEVAIDIIAGSCRQQGAAGSRSAGPQPLD